MYGRLTLAALALALSCSGQVQAQAFGNEAGQEMAKPGKQGATRAQKRAAIDKMAKGTLAELFKTKLDVKAEIAVAGYAVFGEYGAMVLFAGGSGGSGVAIDNKTKRRTYMNVAQASVGIGAGVKDVRTVLVFKTREAFDEFVNKGWEASGQASAAAAAADKGGAADVGQSFLSKDTTSMYQLTPTGLIAEATVTGKKFWKSDLNTK